MAEWPQPHEGVVGVLRDQDDLLSLDDKALLVRNLIRILACHLQRAVGVAQPAPVVERMNDRLRHPVPGDLVVEQSTIYMAMRESAKDPPGDLAYRGFGYFLLERQEWWETDEEWKRVVAEERAAYEENMARHPDLIYPFKMDERSTDRASYVQYGPQPVDITRWTDCSFFVVPTDPDMFDIPFGNISPAGSLILTRDDLLGSLADSGHTLKDPRAYG